MSHTMNNGKKINVPKPNDRRRQTRWIEDNWDLIRINQMTKTEASMQMTQALGASCTPGNIDWCLKFLDEKWPGSLTRGPRVQVKLAFFRTLSLEVSLFMEATGYDPTPEFKEMMRQLNLSEVEVEV